MSHKEWEGHRGRVVAESSGFEVIECECCRYRHVMPLPSATELEAIYKHDYYTQEKPLYIERYQQDLVWWNSVYKHRYEKFESLLPEGRRSLLDVGSGPGYFLKNGQERGWSVQGIEPSDAAAKHSQSMGLNVQNIFFSAEIASALGCFDVINMGEVLEHVPQPAELLRLAFQSLNPGGLVCLIVPNDFNAMQIAAQQQTGLGQWWVAPPHHLNYFDFNSLAGLVHQCGFELVHQEATFPLEMFLLMGEPYVGNDTVGRACHTRRMHFEANLLAAGQGPLLERLYRTFAEMGIGREVVLVARRP